MENESLHETSGAVGKPIAIALSFANLCYLRVWSELLSYTPAQTYEMRSPPAPQHYLAVSLNVLIWGAGFGLAAVTLQRARPALRRAGRIWNIVSIQSQLPEVMRDSMRIYRSIMYGPSPLTRAQREMMAVVTSQVNECHY